MGPPVLMAFGKRYSGRTCLFTRYFYKTYPGSSAYMEGFERTIQTKDSQSLKVNVWWPIGTGYNYYTPMLFRTVGIAIIVFDITDRSSFEFIHTVFEDLKANNKRGYATVLVGTKADDEVNRQVSNEEADELAARFDTYYFETSALNDDEVAEPFEYSITAFIKMDTIRKQSSNIQESQALEANAQPQGLRPSGCF